MAKAEQKGKKHKSAWTQAQMDKALAMREQGCTQVQIAKEMGCGSTSVSYRLQSWEDGRFKPADADRSWGHKDDCFAYSKKSNSCKLLTYHGCAGEECSFYKSKAQFEMDAYRASERIFLLERKARLRLLRKYRGGVVGVISSD